MDIRTSNQVILISNAESGVTISRLCKGIKESESVKTCANVYILVVD